MQIDTPNTQIHDRSLSCLGTGTSIKRGLHSCNGIKLLVKIYIYIYLLIMKFRKIFVFHFIFSMICHVHTTI